ncbi:MAG: cellulase family glycosylhydrolase [Candidatus Omnitrophica bacterium]|nr:cellulase family glycosylhydrolase [Candidatus Omnitrophota bacterium]
MKTKLIALFTLIFLAASPFTSADSDPRSTDSPFGALVFLPWNHDYNNYHYPNERSIKKAIRMIREAGIKMVRLEINWFDVEPSPEVFDFQKHDFIIDELMKHDIKVLGLLQYNARWAPTKWNDPPDQELFTRYVKKTVQRYRDRVMYWEVWNEPDNAIYWTRQDQMRSYTELLKAVYPAIKETDPTAQVLMGASNIYPVLSLKKIYENGGKDFFDIVNSHPFQNPKNPRAIELLHGTYKGIRKTMEKYGDSAKEVWITEIGCPGVKTPDSSNAWWEGTSPTEDEQAEWVRKIYTETLQWEGLTKVFWAFFRDTNHFHNGIDYFGLISRDFFPKPAYKTYQKLSESLKT